MTTALHDKSPAQDRGEGTLVVRVVDPPAGSSWNVSVDLAGNRTAHPVRSTMPVVGTEAARFEHVPVGPTVEVLAMESRGKQMPRRVRLDPPLAAGEVRAVDLAQLVEAAVVFRVLDPHGAPCKEAWIDARVAHGVAGRSLDEMRALRTDAEGRARLVLAAPEGAAVGRLLCVHAHDLQSPGAADEHCASEIPLTCALPRRDTDVGDVQLGPEPVVASGIIVGPESLQSFRSIGVSAAIVGRTLEDSIVLETHVGSDGRFEVRSTLHGGMIALRAAPESSFHNELVAGPPVTVPFGTQDIRLRIDVGCSIEGSVIGAELQPPTIEVRCVGSDPQSGGSRWIGPGSFSFAALSPGTYRIELRASGEALAAVPLLAIDGVVAVPAEEKSDPRLQSIDVTALVRRVRVDVVDQDGQRVLDGACRFSRAGILVGRSEFSRARIDVAVGRAPIDVEVEAPGFEIERASDVQDGQRITLKRGRLLRLKLESRDLLETLQDVRLFVHLVPEGDAHGRSEMRGCLDEGGETNFTDVARGKWRVELELDVDCDAPGPHVRVRAAHPRIVDVGEERTIEVPLAVEEDAIAVARASLPDK
jgi:hypothetical protein